jgi:hypothetical protein
MYYVYSVVHNVNTGQTGIILKRVRATIFALQKQCIVVCYIERCYKERMLYNEQFLSIKFGCYNEYMLQRKRRNTIGRRSTRVRMTCRSFPVCSERQSSYLLSFVRFSYLLICTVYKS